jgi:hypothetical protein
MRKVYVYRDKELVEKQHAAPLQFVRGVISDSIPDMVHPANGKKYDSKSAFRKVTKDHGYIEVGNEKQTDRRVSSHGNFAGDISEAIRKVNEGYRPATESGRFSGEGWQ